MRFVNLEKRNTSKALYLTKKVSTASMFIVLAFFAILAPLTNKQKMVNAISEVEEEVNVDYYSNNGESID